VVAEMCKLIEWPDYDQADAFRLEMATTFHNHQPRDVPTPHGARLAAAG
jgi:hypothetical protein